MFANAAENVRNLFDKKSVESESPSNSQTDIPTIGGMSPQGTDSSFPKIYYKINDKNISMNATVAGSKGNTHAANDEAHQSTGIYHNQIFQSALQEGSKALIAEKVISEVKSDQLAIEIAERGKDELSIAKTVDEKRFVKSEEWSRQDTLTLYACIIIYALMFFWVEVTWSSFLHEELLYSWVASIFVPLVIPAFATTSSLYLKRTYHASDPKLLRKLTVSAVIVASVTFILMVVFLGIENSMTKASVSGGILADGGTPVPVWISLMRTVSQGILEFAVDFILIAIIYDIYEKTGKERYETVQVPNPELLDHVAITEFLRKQKGILDQRIATIRDWYDAQHKALQATLSDVATRLNEKLI